MSTNSQIHHLGNIIWTVAFLILPYKLYRYFLYLQLCYLIANKSRAIKFICFEFILNHSICHARSMRIEVLSLEQFGAFLRRKRQSQRLALLYTCRISKYTRRYIYIFIKRQQAISQNWSVLGFLELLQDNVGCFIWHVSSTKLLYNLFGQNLVSIIFGIDTPVLIFEVSHGGLGCQNQGIYDLLQRKGELGGSLMFLEDNGVVEIRGLAKIRVENEAETLKLFFEGEKLRSYAHHTMNQVSELSFAMVLCKCRVPNLCHSI